MRFKNLFSFTFYNIFGTEFVKYIHSDNNYVIEIS